MDDCPVVPIGMMINKLGLKFEDEEITHIMNIRFGKEIFIEAEDDEICNLCNNYIKYDAHECGTYK